MAKLIQPILISLLLLTGCNGQSSLPVVNDLSVQNVTSSTIQLNWSSATQSHLGYRVYRSADAGQSWTLIDQLPASTQQYIAYNLAPATGFSFKLNAFSRDQEAADSNIVSATTEAQGEQGANWFWWEGESFSSNTAPRAEGTLSPGNNQSLQAILSNGDGFGLTLTDSDVSSGFRYVLSYEVVAPVDGTYFLYVRKPWNYSWFGWAFNTTDNDSLTIVDDSRNRLEDISYIQHFPMSWVEIGSAELTAGPHTFNVVLDPRLFKEPGNLASINQYFYDAFLASTSPENPSSTLKPGAKYAKVENGKWAFEPDPDTFSAEALWDLRSLNEETAGQSGFVSQQGDQFLLGDGEPVRFFGFVKANTSASYEAMRRQAEFYAKRGVNLVRFHKSFYDNSADSMSFVNPKQVDDLQRTVAAYKESGIYTKSSHYFVLGLRINPDWGIDGYTEEWTQNHNRAPFGVMFWDEKMTEAFRDWMLAIYGSVNPYTGITLAEDPALAIIELVNEDNVFFWTHNLGELPPEQLAKLQGRFFDWVINKHGSLQNAYAAWGEGSVNANDDEAARQLVVAGAGDMAFGTKEGGAGKRMEDMIAFYTELQYGWYAGIKAWMQEELGVQCTFVAGNWRTSNDSLLLDIERYTYTAAGVIDLHNYVAAEYDESVSNRSWEVNRLDRFQTKYTVHKPDEISAAYEQVAGHPSFISEFTWVNPSDAAAEGPMMISSVAAMNDIDGFTWFATRHLDWASGLDKWPIASPSILGQFPGTALMYRRGDLQLAPVVVNEGRTLQSMYAREPSIITQSVGFDPTRDSGSDNTGSVDSYSFLVGKVEVSFGTDEDVIDQATLDASIDRDNGTISSATGELQFNIQQGLFTLNTPRSQGATGKLADVGAIDLSDIVINSSNEFGAILVISLQDAPLGSSSEILIQSATQDKPFGWTTSFLDITDSNDQLRTVEQIDSMGELPFNVVTTQATVLLKGITTDHAPVVTVLDENGMPRNAAITQFTEEGLLITLPINALYTHIQLGR